VVVSPTTPLTILTSATIETYITRPRGASGRQRSPLATFPQDLAHQFDSWRCYGSTDCTVVDAAAVSS
jgi:hypothetical protein